MTPFLTFCAFTACGVAILAWTAIITLVVRPRPPLPVQEDLSGLFL